MTTYSLQHIKAHPGFPFTDFKTDTLSFLLLELYWAELARDILGEHEQSWRPGQEADGEDGNPILNLYNPKTSRSVRVIQKSNDENRPTFPNSKGEGTYYPFQPWMSGSMTQDGETELNELVMAADLSDVAEKLVRDFFQRHCIDEMSPEDMEASIRDYEIDAGMPD